MYKELISIGAKKEMYDACPLCDSSSIRFFQNNSYKGLTLYVCGDCGLVFQNPPPLENELRKIYQEGYFEAWNHDRESVKVAKIRTAGHLLQCASNVPSGRLLDIGCAYGYLLKAAAELGYETWGVEFSSDSGSAAKAQFGDRIFIGDLMEAHFQSTFFDVVTLIDVIEHFGEPSRILTEVARVTKLGGSVIVAAPNFDSTLRRVMGNRWVEFKREHITYFTLESLSKGLARVGFKVHWSGLFWKQLPIGYLVDILTRYDPWLVPKCVAAVTRRNKWIWKRRLWLPTDEFVVAARKVEPESCAINQSPSIL